MRCSSQKPISRRRRAISGEAQSCLIRQAVPTRILLSGQMKDGSRPGAAFTDDDFLLTARQAKVIETRLQEGFLRRSTKGAFQFLRKLEKVKAPNSKIQAPKKQQAPSSKTCRRLPRHLFWGLLFEIWNFSGAWGLVLGVSTNPT